ncbi:cd27 binding protein (Siva) domain-containing protein [Phthorimaea operculella]|nr:cd27 binding protein (Siva) domain-containing protein [Phthorimaea operculella]
MAKRANPYAEDYVTQSKVYIGVKQVLNNNESKLKKMYEKTMELLFQGAKKPNLQEALNNNNNIYPSKDKMKQLCIGKDGTLVHTETAVIQQHLLGQCACSRPLESQCAYCEAALCSSCQHGCSLCQKLYCSRCLLVGSEEAEVCLSCYS